MGREQASGGGNANFSFFLFGPRPLTTHFKKQKTKHQQDTDGDYAVSPRASLLSTTTEHNGWVAGESIRFFFYLSERDREREKEQAEKERPPLRVRLLCTCFSSQKPRGRPFLSF